eukprot:GHVO01054145.1.p1 GENE.GHVO01054145.1~~GHVO01054145.1.p1  ORF type:complete len:312 (+),score=46.87 GHVO01054145.1:36-971(+)
MSGENQNDSFDRAEQMKTIQIDELSKQLDSLRVERNTLEQQLKESRHRLETNQSSTTTTDIHRRLEEKNEMINQLEKTADRNAKINSELQRALERHKRTLEMAMSPKVIKPASRRSLLNLQDQVRSLEESVMKIRERVLIPESSAPSQLGTTPDVVSLVNVVPKFPISVHTSPPSHYQTHVQCVPQQSCCMVPCCCVSTRRCCHNVHSSRCLGRSAHETQCHSSACNSPVPSSPRGELVYQPCYSSSHCGTAFMHGKTHDDSVTMTSETTECNREKRKRPEVDSTGSASAEEHMTDPPTLLPLATEKKARI